MNDNQSVTHHKGYVAILDVLGFSAMIGSESHIEDLDRYIKCVRSATEPTGKEPAVEFVLFSDTIILTTVKDDKPALLSMVRACSRLFDSLLDAGIPVRGAVAHGTFFRSSESRNGVFVAGRPLVEAHHFEQQQDWLGIMLAPTAAKQISKMGIEFDVSAPASDSERETFAERLLWATCLQPYDGIPFHQTDTIKPSAHSGYIVVPSDGSLEGAKNMRLVLRRHIAQLKQLMLFAPNPVAQQKYWKAQNGLEAIQERWRPKLSDRAYLDLIQDACQRAKSTAIQR